VTPSPAERRTDTAPAADPRWATASRLWHGAIAVVVAVCFLITFVLNTVGAEDPNTGEPVPPVAPSIWLVRMFSYFTIQSNLLILIAAITLAVAPRRDGRWWRVLRFDAVLGIVITGLVFDTILAPHVHLTGVSLAVTIGFHYFAPWAALAGFLLFGPRPRIDWRTFGLGFSWPVAWIGYTFVHGELSGWYPYFFLNVSTLGFPVALRNTAVVLALGLLLGLGLKLADRLPSFGPRDPSAVGTRSSQRTARAQR
jgi:hypothetical protein